MFWYKATKFIEDHAVQYEGWMSSILIILLPTYHTRRHTRDEFNLHIQHWKPQIAYTIFYNFHTSCYTWETELTTIRSRERAETKHDFAHCWQELYAKVLGRTGIYLPGWLCSPRNVSFSNQPEEFPSNLEFRFYTKYSYCHDNWRITFHTFTLTHT